ALEAAARLDPEGAHIQYTLAVARLRKGDRDGAVRALRRALELNQGYPSARELLDQLTLGPAGSAAAGHGS
ncbi:MAG TPA: tetratricopeptide repeat protein, partial [Anaeromyxobacter sp.]|nr:tetratricopeptide repeat protein [Anaeromyxobacter sp.]